MMLFFLFIMTILPTLLQPCKGRDGHVHRLAIALFFIRRVDYERDNRPRSSSAEGGQSPQRKRARSNYDHTRGRNNVYNDYLGSPKPVFNEKQFARIFRISRSKAQVLLNAIAHMDSFFEEKLDATKSLTAIVCPKAKFLMAQKCLAYGCSPTAFLDYFQMGYSTGRACVIKFARAVSFCNELRAVYLRQMNRADAHRISSMHEDHHGICGMVGSIDCMHVGWRCCPTAWQGTFQGAKKKRTIVLEAFADYSLWIWHACFRHAGTMNDINIWDRSPLLLLESSEETIRITLRKEETSSKVGFSAESSSRHIVASFALRVAGVIDDLRFVVLTQFVLEHRSLLGGTNDGIFRGGNEGLAQHHVLHESEACSALAGGSTIFIVFVFDWHVAFVRSMQWRHMLIVSLTKIGCWANLGNLIRWSGETKCLHASQSFGSI